YASPSFNAGQVIAAPEVAPEFLNSYEIGYKQSFGRKLMLNLAAFYYDYQDFQLPISISNGGVTQAQFINVPSARSAGVEAEAYWPPVAALNATLPSSFGDSAVLPGGTGKTAGATSSSLCLLDTADPNALALGAKPAFASGGVVYQSVKGNALPDAPRNKLAL